MSKSIQAQLEEFYGEEVSQRYYEEIADLQEKISEFDINETGKYGDRLQLPRMINRARDMINVVRIYEAGNFQQYLDRQAKLEQDIEKLQWEANFAENANDQAAVLRIAQEKSKLVSGFWRGLRDIVKLDNNPELVIVKPERKSFDRKPGFKGRR